MNGLRLQMPNPLGYRAIPLVLLQEVRHPAADHPHEVGVLVGPEVQTLEEGVSGSGSGIGQGCEGPAVASAPGSERLNDVAVGVEDGPAAIRPTLRKLTDEFQAPLGEIEGSVAI